MRTKVTRVEFCFFLSVHWPLVQGFYSPAIAVRDIVIADVRLSVRPSVTLSCLRDNLSKHGWILIIFCLWLVTMSLLRTKGDILF